MSWILPTSVLLSFLLGLLAPLLYRGIGERVGRALAFYPLGLFVLFASLAPAIAEGEALRLQLPWIPAAGIHFGFALDGLAMLFVLLITGIGALVFYYAGWYLDPQEDQGKFFAYLTLFLGAMLGVVLADNLILLYLFWEMTSFTSFLLIGFWSHRDESRYGALKALLVTAGGGLALLAGIVLILVAAGTVDISALLAGSGALRESVLYPAILLTVVVGAFTKSAQVPFHLWLPNAMEAPTPVSAYLHSAAMVKAGIYLIARMSGMLGDTALWVLVVSAVGIISLVLGSYLALRQTDLKAILAFSTISQLGLIVSLFGWGTPLAVTAAVFHTLNHSVFKAGLFMMVGIVDHETHTRDIRRLSGLVRYMPGTAAVAGLTSLALAGVPPFNGFISKEMFFKASLGVDSLFAWAPGLGSFLSYAFPILAVLGSTLTFVYSMMIFHGVFLKKSAPHMLDAQPHDPPVGLLLSPVILGVLALLIGIVPGLVDRNVVAAATNAILGSEAALALYLWHGFELPLVMSLAVIGLGGVAYVRIEGFRRFLGSIPSRLNVNAAYDWALAALPRIAEGVTGRMMTGFTRDYFVYLLSFFVVIMGLAAWATSGFPLTVSQLTFDEIAGVELLVVVLGIAATFSILLFRTRVAAVIALGAVGMSIVLLFILFRAPDVALTMLIVETVAFVLFLMVFVYLPRLVPDRYQAGPRIVNTLLATLVGGTVTILMLGVSGVRTHSPISEWLSEHSLSLAHGRNVVNVILVDFRALDTLGEIAVLALAGMGVYILSNLRAKGDSSK